jgi:hypothetical protein
MRLPIAAIAIVATAALQLLAVRVSLFPCIAQR